MKNDEWLTPPEILASLGTFDLDPCASKIRPWPTATKHYTVDDDGRFLPWEGRVWLNPPYGRDTGPWLKLLAEHWNGIALMFARTETEMFVNYVWDAATALLFLYGRLHFYYPTGIRAKANSGAPSVLIAYGDDNAEVLKLCGLRGKYVDLRV